VAEGQYVNAMVDLALLRLPPVLRARDAVIATFEAPLALAASVLTKYVSAPLFLLDLVYALRAQRMPWRRYFHRMVPAGLLGIGIVALFLRSEDFFDGLRMVNQWRFLQPRDALATVELALDISLTPVAYGLIALFPAIALHRLVVLWRAPTAETLIKAALALMAALLFSASSHVWPWYLLWLLAPASLAPSWWLARFAIGVSVMAPFMSGSWWVAPFEDHFGGSALAMYGGAILWAVLTRPPEGAAPATAAPGEAAP
jgi:hypothetical protein